MNPVMSYFDSAQYDGFIFCYYFVILREAQPKADQPLAEKNLSVHRISNYLMCGEIASLCSQ